MIPSRPPIQQIKDSMSATWRVGDFGVVAKTIFAGAEALVTCLAIPFCAHMLDVAYGTGNVAIPLAHQGAFVTGVDIAPNLLAQARERAAAEDLTATFDEGDAERPFARLFVAALTFSFVPAAVADCDQLLEISV
jgi:ubiquinone/menaquinone biosynthesis C-methylase UbiE